MNETVNIVYKIQAEQQQANELVASLRSIQDIAASGAEPIAQLITALESIGGSVDKVNKLRDSLQKMTEGDPRSAGKLEAIHSELLKIISTAKNIPDVDINAVVQQAVGQRVIAAGQEQDVKNYLGGMTRIAAEAGSEAESYKGIRDFSPSVFGAAMRDPSRVTAMGGKNVGGSGSLFSEFNRYMNQIPIRQQTLNQPTATDSREADNAKDEADLLKLRKENAELEKEILENKDRESVTPPMTPPSPPTPPGSVGSPEQPEPPDDGRKPDKRPETRRTGFKIPGLGDGLSNWVAFGLPIGLIAAKALQTAHFAGRLRSDTMQTESMTGSSAEDISETFGQLHQRVNQVMREFAKQTNTIDVQQFQEVSGFAKSRGLGMEQLIGLVGLEKMAGADVEGPALSRMVSLAEKSGVSQGRMAELIQTITGLTEELSKNYTDDPLTSAMQMMNFADMVFNGDQNFRGQGALGGDFASRLKNGLSGISGPAQLMAMKYLGVDNLWDLGKMLEEMAPSTQKALLEGVANDPSISDGDKRWATKVFVGESLKFEEAERVLDAAKRGDTDVLTAAVEGKERDFVAEGQARTSQYDVLQVKKEQIQKSVGDSLSGLLDLEIQLYEGAGTFVEAVTKFFKSFPPFIDDFKGALDTLSKFFGLVKDLDVENMPQNVKDAVESAVVGAGAEAVSSTADAAASVQESLMGKSSDGLKLMKTMGPGGIKSTLEFGKLFSGGTWDFLTDVFDNVRGDLLFDLSGSRKPPQFIDPSINHAYLPINSTPADSAALSTPVPTYTTKVDVHNHIVAEGDVIHRVTQSVEKDAKVMAGNAKKAMRGQPNEFQLSTMKNDPSMRTQ